jgi:hypothetical protein
MSTLFTGLTTLADLVPGVTAALAWAVPMIAVIFVAGWGVKMIFGRRR